MWLAGRLGYQSNGNGVDDECDHGDGGYTMLDGYSGVKEHIESEQYELSFDP